MCGVCFPVRKTVLVCSGNHTGEPVHPQDSLPARASLFPDHPCLYPLLPRVVLLLNSLSSICVSFLVDSPSASSDDSLLPLPRRPPFSLAAPRSFPSLVSTVVRPLRPRTAIPLMVSNNVQCTRARIHTRGNVTPVRLAVRSLPRRG